jgi:ABC-2 type transport system permease protein/oleandomycin transport system permease protein
MNSATTSRPVSIQRPRIVWEALDSLTIAKRNVRTIRRNPDQLLDVTLQPIVFVLIFGVVLGGALQASTGGNYINYLMAGIFVQTALFGSMTTGLGLAEDLQKGLMDRFRSLPMGRSSVMIGRALSDLARSLVAIVVMIGVGILIGFAPAGGVGAWLLGLGLLLLFTFAVSWIAVAIALLLWRNPLAIQGVLFMAIFPLSFLSTAFVPADTLPGWLQVFAANQPVSQLVNALRALMLGQPAGAAPIWVAIWSLGMIAVGIPISVRLYRRMARG